MKLSRRKIRSNAPAFMAGALVSACLVGGVAVASIPATNTGNITSCVNNTTHAVRIIDAQAGAHCAGTEKTVSWSKGWHATGAWSAALTYAVGDTVTYNGSSFVAKAPSTNVAPAAVSTKWTVLTTKSALDTTLPSGKTLRGRFMALDNASAAAALADTAISFGFQLASTPTVEITAVGGTTTHCTGTAAAPTAAPGYVCLYVSQLTNAGAPTAQFTTPFGLTVFIHSSAAGLALTHGAWAVTAP